MNRIKWLLDGYQLSDPALAAVGAFTNSEIQQLYDQLIEHGWVEERNPTYFWVARYRVKMLLMILLEKAGFLLPLS